jgi:hypothetical protein
MTAPNRERLDEMWRRLARFDAPANRVIAVDDPNAAQEIRRFFDDYMRGSAVWLDSSEIAPRPLLLSASTADQCIALNGTSLEFLVIRDDDPFSFRAITEEEYEWRLYASDANVA